jgi:hypothetical protein
MVEYLVSHFISAGKVSGVYSILVCRQFIRRHGCHFFVSETLVAGVYFPLKRRKLFLIKTSAALVVRLDGPFPTTFVAPIMDPSLGEVCDGFGFTAVAAYGV